MLHIPNRLASMLAVALATAPSGHAARPGDAVQPASGARNLALVSAPGGAHLVHGAVRTALPAAAGTRWSALAELSDGYVVAGTRANQLQLLRGTDTGAAVLKAPGGARERFRANPVPLVQNGQLAGLIWLEGDAPGAYRIVAAQWGTAGWSTPWVVTPPGPGSQLALTACVLADGSWLAAWAGFDGQDDEIWWTRIRDGIASKPARAHPDNAVPDVTPTLVATDRGALLAWSFYDGNDYRLALARFADDGFTAIEVESGAGTVEPSFVSGLGSSALLYRSVMPDAWTLLKLDPRGEPLARVAVADRGTLRPAVRAQGENVVLHWEGSEHDATSAWSPLR